MYLYDLVRLFPKNDKSMLRLIYKKEEIFCDRVDYLQFTSEGMLDPICNKQVVFWYILHNPIDPKRADRTTDGRIIVPNIMTVVLCDPYISKDCRSYNEIPDHNITVGHIICGSAHMIGSHVEFVSDDDCDTLNVIPTIRLFRDMVMMREKSNPGTLKDVYHLPNNIYDLKVKGLDLSCYYIDPRVHQPDVTGLYTKPVPRLSIAVEASFVRVNIESQYTGVNFYDVM